MATDEQVILRISQRTGCYNNSMHKKLGVIIVLLMVLAFGAWLIATPKAQNSHSTTASTKPATSPFNKNEYSLSEPTSIWVVVNKLRPLQPATYIPPDLVTPNVPLRVPGNESMQVRKVVASAMEDMFAAAKADQVALMLSSGYRSYTYQVGLYSGYVSTSGKTGADTYSARPGYSEHQTGLAFDVEPLNQQCDVDQCFANLPAGKWIAAHAYEYGFLLRYPADKTSITGYTYEPWHLRYVGKSLAMELHNQHVETLEEFFGLPAAPNYAN